MFFTTVYLTQTYLDQSKAQELQRHKKLFSYLSWSYWHGLLTGGNHKLQDGGLKDKNIIIIITFGLGTKLLPVMNLFFFSYY